MSKRLVLLHTVSTLVQPFARLAAEILPDDVEAIHVADELLLRVLFDRGGLTPVIYRRVADHIVAAQEMGAHAVQLTCSSISPCVDLASVMVGIPVLKIDEPMVEKAISIGSRIGVAATVPTTLKPTSELVRTRARATGREADVEPFLCAGAFDALSAGDGEEHDRIVRAGLRGLMTRNEVVVLAQASMARVADTIPADERTVPLLSSPRLAMERARDVLA
jgi:Asp/Glu/hydantoin racemase